MQQSFEELNTKIKYLLNTVLQKRFWKIMLLSLPISFNAMRMAFAVFSKSS